MSDIPTLLLVHLGNSKPPYLIDCAHQIRLFNPPPTLRIILIADPINRDSEFIAKLDPYRVELRYTDTLDPTPEHTKFLAEFSGDTEFRNGYWRFVKQRFFYMEELMIADSLTNVIAIEYDILLYTSIKLLQAKLAAYTRNLAMVKDNETRSHPGFLFIPSSSSIHDFNVFMLRMIHHDLDDMTLLRMYGEFYPEQVAYLPLISTERNTTKDVRESLDGMHSIERPSFLSDGFDHLHVLFDSAVIGQFVAGIDSRNLDGMIIPTYENEGALYSIQEMELKWKQVVGLWIPILDGHPLVTIHMHSKFLKSFLSDKPTPPSVEEAELPLMLEGWPWH